MFGYQTFLVNQAHSRKVKVLKLLKQHAHDHVLNLLLVLIDTKNAPSDRVLVLHWMQL